MRWTSLAHEAATLEDTRRSRLCPAYHSSGPSREALHALLKPLERPGRLPRKSQAPQKNPLDFERPGRLPRKTTLPQKWPLEAPE